MACLHMVYHSHRVCGHVCKCQCSESYVCQTAECRGFGSSFFPLKKRVVLDAVVLFAFALP